MLSLRSLSARRFRIDGRLPSPVSDEFHQRLRDRRFLPLTAREERAFGWVTADNLLLTDFDADTVVRGEYAAFALRIDRRRANPRVLRAQLDLEIRGRRRAAEDQGQPFRLSREERQELRTDLQRALLAQTSPSIQVHTVLLHPKRRILHALTLSRAAHDVLVALFRDTFGADLLPLTPWRRGGEILAGSPLAASLDALEPTRFEGAPGARIPRDRLPLSAAASEELR
jgi:DNA recombination-dependent growth factor C